MKNLSAGVFLSLFITMAGCAHKSTKQNTSDAEAQKVVQSATDPATLLDKSAPLWSITENVEAPESAFYDPQSGFIFLSNVAGAPDQKDGKGWILKISKDGKTVTKLIEGLNAPKGIRVKDGKLWVSDITDVLEIDIADGKILTKISIPKAKFLNDVAIDGDGNVYVSDMLDNKIYVVSKGKARVFLEGKSTDAPNGLLVKENQLYVASWGIPSADWSTKVPGKLYAWNLKTKKRTAVTPKSLGNLDGLEMDSNGDFLISDWIAGKVYKVTPKGKIQLLVSHFKGSADIGLIDDTLLVPAMGENTLSAYKLK